MKKAEFFEKLSGGKVRCTLCPHACIISEGEMGICAVRLNKKGTLYAKTYEMISSMAMDPIEKKPLDFFMPGTQILSVGTYGCNFSCKFCQNYHISCEQPELIKMSSDKLCQIALDTQQNIGIAFTYNEPFMWYEYMLETCIKNKQNGKKNVIVTNGFINPEPLKKMLPYVDAMNIDLKSQEDDFYKKICGGRVNPVKRTIIESADKCHIEITHMSIPGMNDSEEEMQSMCKWIASINKQIPLHIIPFRPMHEMKNHPGQTYSRLIQLKQIAKRYLDRVVM